MGGRFREAVSDVAETIRRVFKAPAVASAPLDLLPPLGGQVPALEASAREPGFRLCATVIPEKGLEAAAARQEPMAWQPRLLEEPGWEAWEAGARACVLPLFRPGACARLAIAPLPRRCGTRRPPLPALGAQARGLAAAFPRPATRRALEMVRALPVAITGEDLGKLSKALLMRYTLQLVRATGENVRNLEMLGLYRVPSKGARQIRHEPSTGRLLVEMGMEAAGAGRVPFVLARRKDDGSVVYCFAEES